MRVRSSQMLLVVCLGCSLGLLSGCADMEYVSNGRYFFYHKELPAAARAVDEARRAGRDKECAAEFGAAEKMKNDAYELYYACRTREAIAKANEAIAAVNALCPRIPETPKPAPAPPPAPASPAPTISLSADSASVEQGSCTNLIWSTTNASSASIDQGIGSVEPRGSRQVCPTATTRYTLTATGEGGSRTESTTVNVIPRPAAAPIDRLTIHVNFDTDKSQIRKADVEELRKAATFVKKYPGCKISVEGYTDSRGTEAYNQGLSERRAAAVRNYLLENGATDADKITSEGHGESNPIGDNATAKGRFENRRVEIVIVSR
jgi:OmpA-OmpF porin, OOP family